MKLSLLPIGQDCIRNVLRDAPLPNVLPVKKAFWKDKSQYQGSIWEIQQTKILVFPLQMDAAENISAVIMGVLKC